MTWGYKKLLKEDSVILLDLGWSYLGTSWHWPIGPSVDPGPFLQNPMPTISTVYPEDWEAVLSH